MAICGIYQIKENLTGKSYIGQSIDIWRRIKQHQECNIEGWHQHFHDHPSDFSITILEECKPDMLDSREKYWINFYDSYRNGFNKTTGNNPDNEIIINDNSIFYVNWDFNKNDCERLIRMIETPSFKQLTLKLIEKFNLNFTNIKYWFDKAYSKLNIYIIYIMPFINNSCKADDMIYLIIDLNKEKSLSYDKDITIRKLIIDYCRTNQNAPYHNFFYVKNIIGYNCTHFYNIDHEYNQTHTLKEDMIKYVNYWHLKL